MLKLPSAPLFLERVWLGTSSGMRFSWTGFKLVFESRVVELCEARCTRPLWQRLRAMLDGPGSAYSSPVASGYEGVDGTPSASSCVQMRKLMLMMYIYMQS